MPPRSTSTSSQETERGARTTRTGVLLAVAATDYADGQVIRHEKTFDDKVQGRIALADQTGLTTGPVFFLTRAPLQGVLEAAKASAPLYDFAADFGPGTDLSGVHSRVWRLGADERAGRAICEALEPDPLYIADGHHRYHAAIRRGQSHVLAYVTDEARILAYDRVVTGTVPWVDARASLSLTPVARFETPPKHVFAIYTRDAAFHLPARVVPSDPVGRLDCAILERELYPALGLTHDHVVDPAHFDYFPETQLAEMKALVDAGHHELAVALHPVTVDELIAVADAGLREPDVVMPEKSTYFSPKILTGLFVYRHDR